MSRELGDYMTFDEQMTQLADAIRRKTGATKPLTVADMIELVDGLVSDTSAGVYSYGIIDDSGKFQELDLSGDTPTVVGKPLDADLSVFNTGRDEPDYGNN